MIFSTPLLFDQLLDIIQHQVIVKGDTSKPITGINEYHSVTHGDISFVDHPKYYDKVLKSDAYVILINKEVECPANKVLIVTSDPLKDYIAIVKHFIHFTPQKQSIHPDTIIGENTIIQPNTFVGENVKIGKNCIIHSNVSIYADTTIGDNVIIHSGSVIGGDAYYFQRRDEGWIKLESCGKTVVDDGAEIGCNCCIDRGVSGVTYIGKGSKFDNMVQVGHDTHIGNHCLIGAHSAIAGCSFVDDFCSIWAKACVNKDLYVAKNTTLLALSAIDKSVSEEGTVLFGAPAYDARKKWKEMACSKMLPDLFDEFLKLKKELAEIKAKI